jgi:4-hydroxy-tetrahydrodipicolinate synthase
MAAMHGIIAAAATPLTDGFAIDLDRLTGHCRFLLEEGGCDGINLLGTTGEATSFSVETRLAAMRHLAASGLPLSRFMVGTGAAALGDAVRLTRAANALGFAGALLLPPFYYKGIETAALVAYVSTVIDRAGRDGLSLYLYHFPANSGVPYAPEAVARLRDAYPDTVVGLKDSAGDLAYSAELARQLPGFAVFPSAEASLGEAARLGFAGCISATANLTGPFAQRALTGRTEAERQAALAKAVELRALLAGYPLVASVKAALAFVHGEPRWRATMPPLTPLGDAEARALAVALAAAGLAIQSEDVIPPST